MWGSSGLSTGTIAFFIYINDVPSISTILNFYLFADDTNIYYECNSLHELEQTVNKELDKLYLWLNVNRLSLNIDKTNFLIFHPYNKQVKQQVTIKINKKAINNEKETIQYLGVLVDSSLSWKYHISRLTKKISRYIGIMYKLRPFLTLNVMNNVYCSLVYSNIYVIEVWGSAFKTDLDKILTLQKRAICLKPNST